MSDGKASDRFDHLFTETVREGRTAGRSGSWRAIDAPDAVSLSFGFPFPDSFPTTELVTAAEAVFETEAAQALQYGGGEYTSRLAEAITAQERARGINCEPEQILVTNGAVHAIDLISRTFLEPGDPVFVEAPTFMAALGIFRNHGAEVTGIDLDSEGLRIDALATVLERRRDAGQPLPKLLYTIPTFQNPTGTTMTRGRRDRLLELAAEYDFLILEDDAYDQLRYADDQVAPLAGLDETGRVLRVNTFSKTVAPGVRTGWVLGHPELLAELDRLRAGGTNTFTRSILGWYCTEGPYEKNVAKLRARYAERRDHLLARLEERMPPAVEWTEPAGGFFVWVELPAGLDAEELLPAAAEEGVTYLPGELFFPDDRGHNCLRLSFSHASFEDLTRGIEALARTVKSAHIEQ